jgi:hypothetical protein
MGALGLADSQQKAGSCPNKMLALSSTFPLIFTNSDFPLAHTFINILKCHSSVNFTGFHTDRYSSMVNSINGAAMLNVSQHYHNSKDNEN